MITVLALLANVLLSLSFFQGPIEGRCAPLGVLLVLTALALLLEGSVVAWPPRIERAAARLTPALLGIIVVFRLVFFTPDFLTECREGGGPTALAWLLLLAGTVALGSYRLGILGLRTRLPVLLALAMAGQFWIIRAQAARTIDVLAFQEEASAALLAGRNPYEADYTNVYGDTRFYGPGIVRNGRVTFFPYPPLSLLATLPGHLLGDVRYATLAALGGACLLLAATGRKLEIPAGSPYELITVALVLQLDNQVIIALGWTEPFLFLGVTAVGYALAARRRLLLCLALAWIVAIKQYGFLWAIPLLASERLRWREWAIVAAAVAAVNLPFFLWGPRAFWHDLITAQAVAPFRQDLISVPALVHSFGGGRMSLGWSIGAAVAAAAVAVLLRPISAPRAIMGGTAVVVAFIAFSKQGAPNYYWFASAACLVAAVLGHRGGQPVVTDVTPKT